MPTQTGITMALNVLRRVLPANQHPASLVETAAAWMDILNDWTDEMLLRAVRAHLRDPERGMFWPAPANLIATMPRKPEAIDEHVAAWDEIQAEIRAGRALDTDAFEEVHLQALASIGGTWMLRRAEGGAENGGLRKRFLAACKDGEAREITALRIEATPAPLRLAEDPRFGELVKRAGGR